MKNIAVIFAGGVGSRMQNATKPKQFLKIDGKPIIIHTIEKFASCNMVDAISIACREEYLGHLADLLEKFSVQKVKWIVPGGDTGQRSIFNALDAVHKDPSVEDEAVVLIHDGVRPEIDERLILENIVTARTHGNAITVAKATETFFVSSDKKNIDKLLKRDEVFCARAPQTFFLRDIHSLHVKEMEDGNYDNIDSCSILFKHGHQLNYVMCKSTNIKITTDEDFYIFKSLYDLKKKRNARNILK